MAIGYLNERTKKILDLILKQSQPLGMKEIASEFSVSVRTIYNELDKINAWLKMKKQPALQIVRGKVCPFPDTEKLALDAMLQSEPPQEDYIFSPTERTRIIVCQMILSRKLIYVEDLMDTCLVSRNTIFSDLQAITFQLRSYQLSIRYEKKRGYWIDGDPIRVRAIFFLYFNMLSPLLAGGKLTLFHMEEISDHLKRIEQIESALQVSYMQNDMIALAAMIPVMQRGTDHLAFSDVSIRKVKTAKEYDLVKTYFPELSDTEQVYLSLHFLGGRLMSYSKAARDTKIDESVMEISRSLVVEFERQACVTFGQREKLIQDLYQHIASSIYRYQFGIQIGNPMAEDIKREYPYIFDITKSTAQYLEQRIGVQISDSEVAFLALHFGAHLAYVTHDEKELRILVVCMNGVATGNMICHELERILPQCKIVGVMAAAKIISPQNICDLIVSSVNLKTIVPVVVVNPILNDFDRRNILNHPLIRSRVGFTDTEALFQLVKQYVSPERHSDLKRDLEHFFIQRQEDWPPALNPDVWRLTDFLTEDRIVFLDSDHGRAGLLPFNRPVWERALDTVAAPLLARKSMTEEYVQTIVAKLLEAGPYMFITKDLILAHAGPQNGVRHLDLAIGIAPDGIPFAPGRSARIVFLLVVEDQQKHMGILRDIRKALAKPAQVDELMELDNAQQVCEWFRAKLLNS